MTRTLSVMQSAIVNLKGMAGAGLAPKSPLAAREEGAPSRYRAAGWRETDTHGTEGGISSLWGGYPACSATVRRSRMAVHGVVARVEGAGEKGRRWINNAGRRM